MPPALGRRPAPDEPEGPAAVRAHLWVTGRVQGVGFRFFVRRRAEALRVTGFVRNTADGRVEVAAEGAPGAVDALVEEVRVGPAGARVHVVDVTWELPQGERAFAIRSDTRG